MSVFVTGFPGFIGRRLVARLAADRPRDTPFELLCEARFAFAGKQACEAIAADQPDFAGRWRIVVGDITAPALGVSSQARAGLHATVTEVWHLAALYDLACEQAAAYRVNVDGTLNVLAFCRELADLKRLHYISTCYVAGDRTGTVFEDELDVGQGFKNHYESTKCWAEKHVRAAGLPTTIYRPAIVVGDSRTGEADKMDGPYALLQLLIRLPRWVPMMTIGSGDAPVNLVPVDWVVDAMARLSELPAAVGCTVHLADPHPMTAGDLMRRFCAELKRAPVLGAVPGWLASGLVNNEWLARQSRVPPQAFDYFNHSVRFDARNTARLLSGLGAPCPSLPDTLPILVRWANHHLKASA